MEESKNIINIKGLKIGSGIPKIAVPITYGMSDVDNLLKRLDLYKEYFHIIEIRLDFFLKSLPNKLITTDIINFINIIYDVFPDKVLLATFRSKEEGGQLMLNNSLYTNLIKELCNLEAINIVDVESNKLKALDRAKLISFCKNKGKKIILSYHNFEITPKKNYLLSIIKDMDKTDADIYKIALMPHSKRDVLKIFNLMQKNYIRKLKKPMIAISMGATGFPTRALGRFIGSSISFASIDKCSAPGQINVKDLNLLQKYF